MSLADEFEAAMVAASKPRCKVCDYGPEVVEVVSRGIARGDGKATIARWLTQHGYPVSNDKVSDHVARCCG